MEHKALKGQAWDPKRGFSTKSISSVLGQGGCAIPIPKWEDKKKTREKC